MRPLSMAGVKMAVEIPLAYDAKVDVVDFCVPSKEDLDRGLSDTVRLITSGRQVYVGCMGGVGRTGFMLALLAKAWGVPDPVNYVRDNYYPHAVETIPQLELVRDYKIPFEVRLMVWWADVKGRFSNSPMLTRPYKAQRIFAGTKS